MAQKTISTISLNRKMEIANDVKKAFPYGKDTGWYWCDRDEEDNFDAWHGPFDNFLDAVNDAIEPYEHPEE